LKYYFVLLFQRIKIIIIKKKLFKKRIESKMIAKTVYRKSYLVSFYRISFSCSKDIFLRRNENLQRRPLKGAFPRKPLLRN